MNVNDLLSRWLGALGKSSIDNSVILLQGGENVAFTFNQSYRQSYTHFEPDNCFSWRQCFDFSLHKNK